MSREVILTGSVGSLKSAVITAATFYAAKDLGMEVIGMSGASGGSIPLPLLGQNISREKLVEEVSKISEKKVKDYDFIQQGIDWLTPWKRKGDKPFTGALRGNGVEFELKKLYKRNHCLKFSDAKIPFVVFAAVIAPEVFSNVDGYDSFHGMTFNERSGVDCHQAIRASTSIPIVFRPKYIRGIGHLVDGGLIDSLPIMPALQAFGSRDVLLADATNDTFDIKHFTEDINNIFDIITANIETTIRDSVMYRMKRVKAILDKTKHKVVRVHPEGVKIKMFQTKKFEEAFYDAYDKVLEILKQS